MKRISAAFALFVLASVLSNATTTPTIVTAAAAKSTDPCASQQSKFQREQCEKSNRSAPGDEYFGRMKMSYLGINNTFHDQAIRAGAYTTDNGFISRVNFADEALRAWSAKYPGDPQLARSYYLAIQVFKKIYTPNAQNKAWQYMHLLVQRFPTSYFGKLEKKELQIGFTEHYFALPLPCPTPLPSGSKVNGLPSSSPQPLPTDTPTPAPGQPKVQIITPPCVPPPSPTPIPTVAPTAMPTALPITPTAVPTMPTATALPSVSPAPTRSP